MFTVTSLCGSMRFTEEMIDCQRFLGERGYICLLPVFDLKNDGQTIDDSLKRMYKFMHFQRIDMSNDIHVIIVDGYIGSSTQIEIDYAMSKNKKINYIHYKKGERKCLDF